MTKDTNKSKEELEEKDLETTAEQTTEETVEEKEETTTEEQEGTEVNEVEELGKKLQEINDKYIRLQAEFDNYRKRTLKEKMELTKSAGEKILVNVLPVVDNFERALQAMETAQEVEAVKEGVSLIYNNFKEFMVQNGVKEIEAINQEFDTDIHEAITKIPAPSEELKGKVVDCVEKGYTLNEKVIRFSKVVVGE
jgi:molecular chaperone GrpE